VGTSFISEEQARRNLEKEVGKSGRRFEETERETREAWREKLERVRFGGKGGKDGWERGGKWEKVFYTGFWHSLQYPYETSEDGRYYSGESGGRAKRRRRRVVASRADLFLLFLSSGFVQDATTPFTMETATLATLTGIPIEVRLSRKLVSFDRFLSLPLTPLTSRPSF